MSNDNAILDFINEKDSPSPASTGSTTGETKGIGTALMSSLKNLIHHEDATEPAESRNERNRDILTHLIGGGALLGVGGAGIISGINYLSDLTKEEEARDEKRQDDDAIYIPASKSASADDSGFATDSIIPAVGVVGGVGASVLSYKLVKGLYDRMRRKQLEAQLDNAQGGLDSVLEEENREKQAKWGGLTGWDTVLAASAGIPLIALIAAAGLTKKHLDDARPKVKQPKDSGPKRVVLAEHDPEFEELEKDASFNAAHRELEELGTEFLINTTSSLGGKHNVTRNMVKLASTAEGLQALEHAIGHGGKIPTATTSSDSVNDALGVMYIAKSAKLNTFVSTIAAAEFVEKLPEITPLILHDKDPEDVIKFAHLGGILGAIHRHDTLKDMSLVKDASTANLEDVDTDVEAIKEAILHAMASRDSEGDNEEPTESAGVPLEDIESKAEDYLKSIRNEEMVEGDDDEVDTIIGV